jgi:hypothetical protein
VQVGDQLSYAADVKSGVPQGTVLGPLLFILYINDLPENIKSSIRLFADDCIIYREIDSETDINTLQQDLVVFNDWSKKWLMPLNLLKCNTIHFSRSIREIQTQYFIGEHSLAPVKEAKYLGVTLSDDLSWNKHINNVSASAQKVLNVVRRNFWNTNSKTKEICYKTLVRPIIDYGSNAWSPYTIDGINSLERINKRAARFVHNEYRRPEANYVSSITQLYKRTGWQTMNHRFTVARLSMLHKTIQGQSGIDTAIPFNNYQSPRASNTM